MIALAQASAGLALVMGFALLRTRQIAAAAILLLVQSVAVALAAIVMHRPLLAMPPVLLAGGLWLLRQRTPMLDPATAPAGGGGFCIAAGAVLTILCQSQGGLALPCAIVLLSMLLGASRSHPLMRIIALVVMQNGLALAASLVPQPAFHAVALLPPFACFVLPIPLAVELLAPALLAVHGTAGPRLTQLSVAAKAWATGLRRIATWFRWIDLAIAIMVFTVTFVVPLDQLASIFGPLLGLDAVLRSCARLNRAGLTPTRRSLALAQTICTVAAVCVANPIISWLFVLASVAMALFPTLTRRWDSSVLAFFAAGLVLFGVFLLPVAQSVVAYFSLFAGLAMVAVVVPDLSVVAVIQILRLANQTAWPSGVGALGVGIALIALLACASLLLGPGQRHRATLLQLAQASIAGVAVCLGQPDGRFAALILLILLILTRAGGRRGGDAASTVARTGLSGLPPFGVFPGLVLIVLALGADAPWLLLPLGAALIAMVSAALPRCLPDIPPRLAIPSIAWLPLLLAALVGYAAPERLVVWCRILTAGRS